MKQKHFEIIKEIVDLCPKDVDLKTMRTMVLSEEMSELNAVMMQNIRKPDEAAGRDKVIEEIADVYISLEAYKLANKITDEEIEHWIDQKTGKLAKRIEKIKNKEVYY